jgi:hypothetical protein
VEPTGRFVYIGLAGEPSLVDTRHLALKNVTAVGGLSASPALDDTIDAFASGAVDPRPLVAGVVPVDRTADVVSGWRPADAVPGPTIHRLANAGTPEHPIVLIAHFLSCTTCGHGIARGRNIAPIQVGGP